MYKVHDERERNSENLPYRSTGPLSLEIESKIYLTHKSSWLFLTLERWKLQFSKHLHQLVALQNALIRINSALFHIFSLKKRAKKTRIHQISSRCSYTTTLTIAASTLTFYGIRALPTGSRTTAEQLWRLTLRCQLGTVRLAFAACRCWARLGGFSR